MTRRQYSIVWFFRKVRRKVTGNPIELKKYAGKSLNSKEEAGKWLSDWIEKGIPFMAGRFGSVELNAMVVIEKKGKSGLKAQKLAFEELNINAGFFPNDITLMGDFCEQMYSACKSLDLLGTWSKYMEDYVVEKYCKECLCVPLISLEPWYTEIPWTRALKGKKVLVIHPFEKTIQKQYKNRDKLFPETEILPEFEKLYTLKAVQTVAEEKDERFKNWFEALEWMYQEAMKIDFDIAIIGCGAYGFPLAARIKKAGKQAVHMGGATQILFGIKGKRWDKHPVIGKLYNEFWVRPDESETPQSAKKIEQGCYW